MTHSTISFLIDFFVSKKNYVSIKEEAILKVKSINGIR